MTGALINNDRSVRRQSVDSLNGGLMTSLRPGSVASVDPPFKESTDPGLRQRMESINAGGVAMLRHFHWLDTCMHHRPEMYTIIV